MKKINNKGFTHKVGTLSLSIRVYVTTCVVYNIQYSLLYYTYTIVLSMFQPSVPEHCQCIRMTEPEKRVGFFKKVIFFFLV